MVRSLFTKMPVYLMFFFLGLVGATDMVEQPNVTLSFNAQSPIVARIGQPYSFQFSASTFQSHHAELTYTLADAPTWLKLDSGSRALLGTPTSADQGLVTFDLIATDSTSQLSAQTSCTLVVSAEPAPRALVGLDLAQQFAAAINLSASCPTPVITLRPAQVFSWNFPPSVFVDVLQRQLFYSATLTDHTPLPSWLVFDSDGLRFSGRAPQFDNHLQSWDVALMASDVAGFSAAIAIFTVTIANEQLIFVPGVYSMNLWAGADMNLTDLPSLVYRNGVRLSASDLKGAMVRGLPAWMDFDPATLRLWGQAPRDVGADDFEVIVVDQAGNNASVVLNVVRQDSPELFASNIGTIVATAGQTFDYLISPSLFTSQDVEVNVTWPDTATWLTYDPKARELQGVVPSQATETKLIATLAALATNVVTTKTQLFTINVQASTTGNLGHTPRHTTTPVANFSYGDDSDTTATHFSSGAIAGIIFCCIFGLVIVVLCILFWRRRYKKQSGILSRHNSRANERANNHLPHLPRHIEGIYGVSTRPENSQRSFAQSSTDLTRSQDASSTSVARELSHLSPESIESHAQTNLRGEPKAVPGKGGNPFEPSGVTDSIASPGQDASAPLQVARYSQRMAVRKTFNKRALNRIHNSRYRWSPKLPDVLEPDDETSSQHTAMEVPDHRRGLSGSDLSSDLDTSSQVSASTVGTSLLSATTTKIFRLPTSTLSSKTAAIRSKLVSKTSDIYPSIRLGLRRGTPDDGRLNEDLQQSAVINQTADSLMRLPPVYVPNAPSISNGRSDSAIAVAFSQAQASKAPESKTDDPWSLDTAEKSALQISLPIGINRPPSLRVEETVVQDRREVSPVSAMSFAHSMGGRTSEVSQDISPISRSNSHRASSAVLVPFHFDYRGLRRDRMERERSDDWSLSSTNPESCSWDRTSWPTQDHRRDKLRSKRLSDPLAWVRCDDSTLRPLSANATQRPLTTINFVNIHNGVFMSYHGGLEADTTADGKTWTALARDFDFPVPPDSGQPSEAMKLNLSKPASL